MNATITLKTKNLIKPVMIIKRNSAIKTSPMPHGITKKQFLNAWIVALSNMGYNVTVAEES